MNVNQFLKITKLCLSVFLLTLITQGPANAMGGAGDDSKDSADIVMPSTGDSQGKIYGKVIETIDSGSYTYVHVDDGKDQYWAATAPVTLQTGSMVSFGTGMPMTNFTSKTLDRTFDLIYFVGQIKTDKVGNHAAKADAKSTTGGTPTNFDDTINVDNIMKAANGITIDEALTQKQKLAGQTVLIRGVVVKYTPKVMNKNWIHIRDSSSSENLTITTSNTVKKGDVILVTGKLQLDRDFGYGYVYDVLLEDSSVTIE
jgi:hypothetical protein